MGESFGILPALPPPQDLPSRGMCRRDQESERTWHWYYSWFRGQACDAARTSTQDCFEATWSTPFMNCLVP